MEYNNSVVCTLLIKLEDLPFFTAGSLTELYQQLKNLPSTFLSLHGEPTGNGPDHIHGVTALKHRNKKKNYFTEHLKPLLKDEDYFEALYQGLVGTLADTQHVREHMPAICCPSAFIELARDFHKPRRAFDLFDLILAEEKKSANFEPTECMTVRFYF